MLTRWSLLVLWQSLKSSQRMTSLGNVRELGEGQEVHNKCDTKVLFLSKAASGKSHSS